MAEPAPPLSADTPALTLTAPDTSPSLVERFLRILRREPILFVTLGYLAVSTLGLWASYWYYHRLGIPVLEFMQASDILVAGLRDPAYALWVLVMILVVAFVNWPEYYRRRKPQRAEELRRHWWGRMIFPGKRMSRLMWWGMHPDTAAAFGVFWGTIWLVFGFVTGKADAVKEGGGHVVRVTLAGDRAPLAGDTRFLGTTSAFVFLYWPGRKPGDGRAEALPIESIARIEARGEGVKRGKRTPAEKPRTAPTATAR